MKLFGLIFFIFTTSTAASLANTNSPGSTSPPAGNIDTKQPKKEIVPTSSRGQLLYNNHCMVCHESNVHIRNKRKAHSRIQVRSWVIHWQQDRKLRWKKEEIEAVTDYLVNRYYKF